MERQRHKLLCSLLCYVAEVACSTAWLSIKRTEIKLPEERHMKLLGCLSVLAGMRTLLHVRASDRRVRNPCRVRPSHSLLTFSLAYHAISLELSPFQEKRHVNFHVLAALVLLVSLDGRRLPSL